MPLLRDVPAYQELLHRGGEGRVAVLEAAKPCFLASLAEDLQRPILVITARLEVAKQLFEELQGYLSDEARLQLLPELEVLPYERLSPDPTTLHQRLRVLSALSCSVEESSPLIVASLGAVVQKTLRVRDFQKAIKWVQRGMGADLKELVSYLHSLGYRRKELVESPGTMAFRGGILDFYSPSSDFPVRLEFFGQQIETLRYFDPATQRSIRFTESVLIVPAQEMLPSRPEAEQAIKLLDFSNCSPGLKARFEEELELVAQGNWFEGMEFYAPLFNKGALTNFLPPDSLIVLDSPELIKKEFSELEAQEENIRKDRVSRGELPQNFPRPHLSELEFWAGLGARPKLLLDEWGEQLPLKPAPVYSGRLSTFLTEIKRRLEENQRVVIISQQAERLAELLQEQDILVAPQAEMEQLPSPGQLSLVQGAVSGGWEMDRTLVFSDAELFGLAKPPPRRLGRRKVGEGLLLSELSPGDLVVHVDHGIAKFSGLTRLTIDGVEREYLLLEYAEGDRLYVPSDQVDRLSRYIGPGGQLPALTRLKTRDWARTKQRVRRATEELAKELLELYAAREVSPGFAFSPDTLWQRELEASFPYPETPDQMETIREVKKDMENPRPMDRLILGDVGYGKTEIALRAAFKAVMDGRQVALLVPTTVLAQQHFNTFRERLQPFPVRVEVLSRFRSRQEQREVVKGLKTGAVDICIGTHRLLQKDVSFKNLGLVIVDEEQKFGVVHKEKLKKLRCEVDVLTLSATPIPRTLHMALVGIRDLSKIETPPEGRLPVETYVGEKSWELIREAILRELRRGGQVFFVHNRVRNIGRVAEELRRLVPEARVGIAHGQLREEELEHIMLDFLERRIDVLVCTTIVESGLDLPNVNTLIVDQADRLGLTQLHHLRGRVGRGMVRAYAYFLYERGKRLTELARKRLRTIREASSLGSGFRIALKDLEIRGAGNLLGREQSGHIGAVGFELYSRLLAEAVERLKAEREGRKPTPRPTFPTVDLPLPAYLPEEYVPGLSSRLALYQQLADAQRLEEVDELEQELVDRFGPLPPPARNLLYLVRLRVLGAQAGITAISCLGRQVVIRMARGIKPEVREKLAPPVRAGTNQIKLSLREAKDDWPHLLERLISQLC